MYNMSVTQPPKLPQRKFEKECQIFWRSFFFCVLNRPIKGVPQLHRTFQQFNPYNPRHNVCMYVCKSST